MLNPRGARVLQSVRPGSRSMACGTKLCNDHLRYQLMNIIKPSFAEKEFVRRRHIALSTKNLMKLIHLSRNASQPCEYLYSLLYSRYFTVRFIITDENDVAISETKDDKLKRTFNDIVTTATNEDELQEKYLAAIREVHGDEHFKLFEEFETKQMVKFREMTPDQRELVSFVLPGRMSCVLYL